MALFIRKNHFSAEQMIEMEMELRNSELYRHNLVANDADLSKKLKLKIEYVDDMDDDCEAELVPFEGHEYLGLIKIRKEAREKKFAYIHEIIHFIFDVGYGQKVTKKFTRKRKGKTDSAQEQKVNYKSAAYVMPYDEVLASLKSYDTVRPKMDEVKFVRDMQKKYDQSEKTVLRRIREVRKISKSDQAKQLISIKIQG